MSCAVAVDLGGSELRVGLVEGGGKILAVATTPTDSRGGPQAVIAQIVALAARVRAEAEHPAPVGVGVAAPGPLDSAAGIAIGPPTLEGWHEVPLASLLEKQLGLPVRLENDANAAALGEWRFGAGRDVQNIVFVTVSTGIGGGVIANGRLLHGHRGLAAEIGQMTVDARSSESLFGGATGVWEALASGTALGRRAGRRALGADGARLRELAGNGPITARHVAEAARQDDRLAIALLDEEADLLGIGFANLLHLYSPERLIVGGGLGAALDLMASRIADTVRERALPAFRDVPIVPAALGSRAGLIGAASLILSQSPTEESNRSG